MERDAGFLVAIDSFDQEGIREEADVADALVGRLVFCAVCAKRLRFFYTNYHLPSCAVGECRMPLGNRQP